MATAKELVEKTDKVAAKIDAQTEQIAALRGYVTTVEQTVRSLQEQVAGMAVPPDVQEAINVLAIKLDTAAQALDSNAAGLAAAGDGDITT